MYKAVDPHPNFPKMEQEILKFWYENKIFARSLDQNKNGEEFTFYDGPPFATGLPHYGHIMVGVIKDAIQRYNTMLGKYVPRRCGWDCHGLPVEYRAEKNLKISGKNAIENFGIDNFNEYCRSIVLEFTTEWRRTVRRSGRWVDFNDEYKTMDPDYMESIWWVVKQLWDKNLLYQGHYILPYCPRCCTVLSNHDVALGGYRDIHDPAVTVRFTLCDNSSLPKNFSDVVGDKSVSFLAWTTTPWTLPANLGLALNPNLDYALVLDSGQNNLDTATYVILLQSKVATIIGQEAAAAGVIAVVKGSELANLEYKPPFNYFLHLRSKGAFRSHCASFVSAEDGCGIVHCAPGFGEDDYKLLQPKGVPAITPIDEECRYTSEVKDFSGQFVRTANKNISKYLHNSAAIFRQEQILHSYPHCWRCESPLIYRAISSWFVAVKSLREKLLQANAKIHWVPSHLRAGRFGNWLRNARDWSISRNRYWGNPLPIWQCAAGHQRCLSSRSELEELTGTKITDLHRHFIDHLEFDCAECAAQQKHPKNKMRRVSEVLDCWFESGAMPYAQNHYPFENKEWFEQNFPAHFINESLDQTRGWFYTLTVLSTALFDRPAFKSCITSGMILAEDGKKMSKSLRNYTAPEQVMDNFGADALRLYLFSSAVVKGEPLCFADAGVKNVLKSTILPLWNAYSFYVTYANADGIFPQSAPQNPQNPLDQWIISELETLLEKFKKAMENLLLPQAVAPLLDFIDLLNNWYIRRSRRRFWKSQQDADKCNAYATLWHVLTQLLRLTAPLLPFISETMYRGLQTAEQLQDEIISVHLCRLPQAQPERRRPQLEARMKLARRCVSLGRALRAKQQIRNRLPLSEARIVTREPQEKAMLEELLELIAEELNVKRVYIDDNEEELVHYSAKANFRVLGKLLGKDMKALAAAVENLETASIGRILAGEAITINFAGNLTGNFSGPQRQFTLTAQHLDIRRQEKEGFQVLNEASLTLALQTAVSPELYSEGLLRDIVRLVQNLRKEKNLQIAQRIEIQLGGSPVIKEALQQFGDQLLRETQGTAWHWLPQRGDLKNYNVGQSSSSTEQLWLGIQDS